MESVDGQVVDGVDEIVVVTGFRPDLSILSEVRLDLDPVLQSPRELAPLIDPNVHSCGTVYPHGAKELAQPEAGFFLAGMKSYGRAPSFLTPDRLRAGAQHRGRHRWRHRRGGAGRAGAARDRRVRRSGQFEEPAAEASGGCCGPASSELLEIAVPAAR